MQAVCQISSEPGANLVYRNSRLMPDKKLLVKESYYDKGFEPRWLILMYGRAKYQTGGYGSLAQDKQFLRIIDNHLYVGEPIELREIFA